ncbi:LLM class flavin-dependent oxidoreductase [Neisseria sp. Ec49-e6-T10]|uniref:LLM class flavin-dependent oxidoreductase n=1 Tax=Neisseria sp. Ec49-e6-T10 TaxID=3140744 RepID=UPI003EBE0AC3
MIPFSILDLVPVVQNKSVQESFHNSLRIAQYAEQLGFTRYWVAEHHNMPNIASAATAVVMGYLASGTKNIRIGSGGVMLPNHPPLVIAEQFGTLETLYPGRIDLGVGRAPGTDMLTIEALRRDVRRADYFAEEIEELRSFFAPVEPQQTVQAVPGAGLNIPIWVLGSSLHGAQVAANLGLPYVFASHFAPDFLLKAISIYRHYFKPSAQLQQPYVMAAVNMAAADSMEEAKHLFTTTQQSFTNLLRGQRQLIAPPIANIDDYWTESERAKVNHMLKYSFVGTYEYIAEQVKEFVQETSIDELMIVSGLYDVRAREKTIQIAAKVAQQIE